MHLSKNQRFAEAQRWFHYIFDPTDDSDGPTPERFWKVQAVPDAPTSSSSRRSWSTSRPAPTRTLQRRDDRQHRAPGRTTPFRPHVVARYRPVGLHVQDGDGVPGQPDRLGRLAVPPGHRRERSTRRRSSTCSRPTSSGPRPQAVPRKGSVRPQTYASLRARPRRSSATRCVEHRGGHPVRPGAAARRRRRRRRADWPTLRSIGPHAVLLRAAQRQAARLLGHRRRPAVQDPQQPEHPGRLPPAAAVRAADRPGAAGPGGRGRARRRRGRQRRRTSRCRSCASSCSSQKATEICQEVKSLGGEPAGGDREGGRRGAGRSCAPGTSGVILELAEP